MSETKIFVNLPVKNLDKSKEFFKKLGYRFNPQFTDQNAACLVISEDIYAMFLVEPFFKGFNKKEIADTKKSAEVMIALSFESKSAVDKMFQKALSVGGKESGQTQDHGFMYGKAFEDLDGHIWEIFWMDPNHIQKEETTASKRGA